MAVAAVANCKCFIVVVAKLWLGLSDSDIDHRSD
jgi:hypothetical protein